MLAVSIDPFSSEAISQDVAWPEDAIEVGRVLGAWGVKGWVKIQSFSTDSKALLTATRWWVKPPEGGALSAREVASASSSEFKVLQAKEHGGLIVALIQGVTDRSQAEALRGVRLFLARAHFPAAKAGEYYWIDLIGLSVANREGVVMGQVVGLIDTGPHSVLRLAKPAGESTEDGAERLIPFVAAYVDEVNLTERRITVDWGLDY